MLEQLAIRGEPTLALAEGDALVACVVGDDIDALFEQLRERTSRGSVRALGRDQGYRIEDATSVVLAAGAEAPRLAAWLRRRLAREVRTIERPGPVAIAMELAARIGRSPERVTYARDDKGRVRVEAFELHVAEHCNLRCANCCNMSPLVGDRVLSVAAVEELVNRMAPVLHTDVVKIMGGEPLLHPAIASVIRVLRASGIGDRVRLFTNGLLLASQGEDFWEALDELTISVYTSAPVKPKILEMARARAKRHDFVLNIKLVSEFSQVLSPEYLPEPGETFARCWLRHRCLVVRDHMFYMCTRAAYADDFLQRVAHEPAPAPLDRSRDGVSIDTPDLAVALAEYLNRPEPLGACHYCFGGDGATEPHYQLTRTEVAAGTLSRRLRVG